MPTHIIPDQQAHCVHSQMIAFSFLTLYSLPTFLESGMYVNSWGHSFLIYGNKETLCPKIVKVMCHGDILLYASSA